MTRAEPLLDAADRRHLRRTLELAARGRATTSPNPHVGSVIVAPGRDRQAEGRVVGEGWHRRAGGPHAEIEALRDAGEGARGAVVYVNLEPCAHQGRTPPCADALIEAGVSRVVACLRDPDPRVQGGGFERLRSAGVEVACLASPDLARAAASAAEDSAENDASELLLDAVRLNWRFLASTVYRRPAVLLKWAMSLDGRIATVTGDSQWISSPAGRRWALALREEHDAILVGSGTALADDPRLDRRLDPQSQGAAGTPILRVVLDRRLRLEPTARLFEVEGPIVVYTEPTADPSRVRALEERGDGAVDVVTLERGAPERGVTPERVLADLGARGVRSLLVEGGGTVAAAFAEADCFDRVAVCCAPRLIGGEAAPGPVRGRGVPSLGDAPRLADLRSSRRGPDLVLTAFRERCLQDLLQSVAD